ncbi:MAG TPA: hypothetical protein VN841_19230 [Bryobacteraceae bacterium]|nr:hypothetical protein [Bryobacteraceae bacterium]
MRKQSRKPAASREEEIDRIVTSQDGLGSAWAPSIKVKRFKAASLSIPGKLAARATLLAKLHREKAVGRWVERVLRERIELEEFAFAEAKRNSLLDSGKCPLFRGEPAGATGALP